MTDHEAELARLRAELDQAKEAMGELAGSLWRFYSDAVEAGFTEAQAMTLTLGFLKAGLGGGDQS